MRRRLRRITHDNLIQHNLCWNHTSFLFLCCGSIIVQGIIYKDTVSFVPARLRRCVYPFRIHGTVLDFLTSCHLENAVKSVLGFENENAVSSIVYRNSIISCQRERLNRFRVKNCRLKGVNLVPKSETTSD